MARHTKSFKIEIAEISELKGSSGKAIVEIEFNNHAVIFVDTGDCDVTVDKRGVIVE